MIKLSNRVPYMYFDQCQIQVKGNSLLSVKGNETDTIPVANVACILLGPGTSITHAAIKMMAYHRTRVVWTGEEGVKIYSAGEPLEADAARLKQQAQAESDPKMKARVLQYMYQRRFGKIALDKVTVESFRGQEGTISRLRYKELAEEYGVVWSGRGSTSDINKAIDIANNHLYQAATIAILAAGYSPAIGFVHSSFERSFAADIADFYKFNLTIPLAFRVVGKGITGKEIPTTIRHALREFFRRENMMEKLITDCKECIDASVHPNKP